MGRLASAEVGIASARVIRLLGPVADVFAGRPPEGEGGAQSAW
jgi:hypothetical protein